MSALYEVLFGRQVQGKKINDAIEYFVKAYISELPVDQPNWNDNQSIAGAISAALGNVADRLFDTCNRFEDASTGDKLFLRMFLGDRAIEDMWNHIKGTEGTYYGIDHEEADNGKESYWVQLGEDDIASDTIFEIPASVSSESDATKIVHEIISACAPSLRAKYPSDDKLAALLMSQSYWQGKI